jgi:hypothetical protein
MATVIKAKCDERKRYHFQAILANSVKWGAELLKIFFFFGVAHLATFISFSLSL